MIRVQKGQSLVEDSRFTVVGRMSMADKPAWREGVASCGEQSWACSTKDRLMQFDAEGMRWQGPVGVGRAGVLWVASLWLNVKLLPRLRELSQGPLPIEMWSLGSSALGDQLLA